MNYEEKSELKEEIAKSSKRKMKTCVIQGILIFILEIIVIGCFTTALAGKLDKFDVVFFTYLYCVLRYIQLGLLAHFNAE